METKEADRTLNRNMKNCFSLTESNYFRLMHNLADARVDQHMQQLRYVITREELDQLTADRREDIKKLYNNTVFPQSAHVQNLPNGT